MKRRTQKRAILIAVEVALVALMSTACGIRGSWTIPPESNTTLMSGWESLRDRVDVVADSDGRRRIVGYVTNFYGRYAQPVRVLGQARDASGHPVVQRVSYVLGGVPGGARGYFEIDGLSVANSYQVTIWDYTFNHPRG
jgi:hypothetical protein